MLDLARLGQSLSELEKGATINIKQQQRQATTKIQPWHTTLGLSTFLNNKVEPCWAAADVLNGKTKHDVTQFDFQQRPYRQET